MPGKYGKVKIISAIISILILIFAVMMYSSLRNTIISPTGKWMLICGEDYVYYDTIGIHMFGYQLLHSEQKGIVACKWTNANSVEILVKRGTVDKEALGTKEIVDVLVTVREIGK